ncbi:MAG TPA: hypothetical protein VKC54_02605 [Patescibacteria group bacterium]|nr:hypothetical protein [Patescibacteria group bacterium]
MVERIKGSNNELEDAVPSYVDEVFLKLKLFGNVNSLNQDNMVDFVFKELPKTDEDRDGWLRLVGISLVGFFKQSERQVSKEMFIKELQSQLQSDYVRWGDTWKKRTIEGQLERSYKKFNDYIDQYKNANQPMPWLKVAGNAVICLARLDNPDYKK